jgi:quercetin dioxygenase-like cupin family protein
MTPLRARPGCDRVACPGDRDPPRSPDTTSQHSAPSGGALHQNTHRPLRLAATVVVLALALLAALIALPRDRATATPPSGIAAELLARGTIAQASHVRVAGIKLATRGPIDVATVHVTFQPGGSTGWHIHPGPALVTVKTGQLTLHRAKGCRTRTFSAGQTFLEFGPNDVNLTRNETGSVTETVVTFLLPVGAPITVDAPAPDCQL